jgi:alkylation response protein AidB-like acyl-CoA dehydrogenase
MTRGTTSSAVATPVAERLRGWWRDHNRGGPLGSTTDPAVVERLLGELIAAQLLDFPLPGGGATASRFEQLAVLGELDLVVGRLAEAHADALAILAEVAPERPVTAGACWGVWAAEPPQPRVTARLTSTGEWYLSGQKSWCSGAAICSHALVTADAADGRRLFAVELAHPAVTATGERWPAIALAGTDTRSVDFADAPATAVGGVGSYLDRPGFWHGAAGVAAVWYGGAVAVGRRLLDAGRGRELSDIDAAHLGAVGSALTAARSTLTEAARAIDADPQDRSGQAAVTARATRAVVEGAATAVIDRVGRALGPAPLATDETHLRRVADLQLYVRQSHADRDLADLGRRLIATVPQW